MAAAEAEVHGRGEEDEHLHELSDVDTAVDLICAATLLAKLAPERVVASPPALGDGEIETAHGTLSVPAPAVLSLLSGLPTAGGAPAVPAGETPAASLGELTTPTGAALLAHYAEAFGGMPAGRVERVGYGAGRREVPGRPNVLRAVLVDPAGLPDESVAAAAAAVPAPGGHGAGDHVVLEANIDDMTPELLAHAAERAARGGRARRVDEPGAHEEGPPRRDPPRARGGGRPRAPQRTPSSRRPPPLGCASSRASASTSRSGARASRSASSR